MAQEKSTSTFKTLGERIQYFETKEKRKFATAENRIILLNPDEELQDGTSKSRDFDKFFQQKIQSGVFTGLDTERTNFKFMLKRYSDLKDKMEGSKPVTENDQYQFSNISESIELPAYAKLKEAMQHHSIGTLLDDMRSENGSLYPELNDKKQDQNGPIATIQIAAGGWALYLRVAGLDLRGIVDSTRQDGLARRLRTMVNYIKNRNIFKVLSNARSDTIPLISQFGVDVVSWIELNLLAEWLKFPDFGRNAKGQSIGLKNIGGQCGLVMKDCPFYVDFSSRNVQPWVLNYALLDAILCADIACMLFLTFTKTTDKIAWALHVLEHGPIEKTLLKSRKRRPDIPLDALVEPDYRNFANPAVKDSIIKHTAKKQKKFHSTPDNILSKINSFRITLRSMIDEASKTRCADGFEIDEEAKGESWDGFHNKLHNLLRRFRVDNSSKPFETEQSDDKTKGRIVFDEPVLGLNFLPTYSWGSIPRYKQGDRKDKRAKLVLGYDEAAFKWSKEALSLMDIHIANAKESSEIEHLLI